jgi:hypothetical protein
MRKLLDRIPDPTLNKIGRRYNLFATAFLGPYVIGVSVVAVAHALGLKWAGDWTTFAQLAWVLLWLPNLALIGVRADRDYRTSADLRERMHEADREFFAAHAARMAWMLGDGSPPLVPPTVN